METYTKEITFLGLDYDLAADAAGTPGKWKKEPVTKMAHFKELDQTDREQHKFHFKIMSFLSSSSTKTKDEDDEDEAETQSLNSDALYDITTKYIKKMLVIDEGFSAADRESFLSDSGAIMDFSLWVVKEKFHPFFLSLKRPSAT